MKYLVITMYDELQKIIAPNTISSFEYTKIEELLKTYSEKEILNAYRNVGYKPITYITKVLSNKKTITTDWIKQEVVNEPIDEETEKIFNDFQEFIKDFRGEKNDRKIN